MATEFPTVESLVEDARKAFQKEFNSEPEVRVCAPGRVNLIGEHTDYNEGFVLPMALPLVTVIVGSKIPGTESTVVTLSKDIEMPRRVSFQIPCKSISACKEIPKWALYVKGVVANYIGKAPAFQAVIISSVPIGGGLSSSAAIEVATYMLLDALTGPNTVPLTDKALACQKAEHEYAGMPCGIMDQFISFMGKKDKALLIDCKSITSNLIPFFDSNIVILITNSNVKHELTGSEYPTRRKQCEQAAALLKKSSLREAVPSDIDVLKSMGADPELIKRARHVISEIDRTAKAADALSDRNFNLFGELMVESHVSLKEDYEVSCAELDSLVELALQVQGVLGSRMTGGGFGGCTVSMVHRDSVDKVINNVMNNYNGKPTFYVCKPSEGARIL